MVTGSGMGVWPSRIQLRFAWGFGGRRFLPVLRRTAVLLVREPPCCGLGPELTHRVGSARWGAEGSWHGLPERDSLWTVRVVRGGVVLFSFLFLVRKAVVPDRYPVSQGTVSGPASGCSVTRVCEACPFQGEAGGHRRVPRCSCVQKHKLLVAPGSLWWSHQNCGQHRGAGGLTSA